MPEGLFIRCTEANCWLRLTPVKSRLSQHGWALLTTPPVARFVVSDECTSLASHGKTQHLFIWHTPDPGHYRLLVPDASAPSAAALGTEGTDVHPDLTDVVFPSGQDLQLLDTLQLRGGARRWADLSSSSSTSSEGLVDHDQDMPPGGRETPTIGLSHFNVTREELHISPVWRETPAFSMRQFYANFDSLFSQIACAKDLEPHRLKARFIAFLARRRDAGTLLRVFTPESSVRLIDIEMLVEDFDDVLCDGLRVVWRCLLPCCLYFDRSRWLWDIVGHGATTVVPCVEFQFAVIAHYSRREDRIAVQVASLLQHGSALQNRLRNLVCYIAVSTHAEPARILATFAQRLVLNRYMDSLHRLLQPSYHCSCDDLQTIVTLLPEFLPYGLCYEHAATPRRYIYGEDCSHKCIHMHIHITLPQASQCA